MTCTNKNDYKRWVKGDIIKENCWVLNQKMLEYSRFGGADHYAVFAGHFGIDEIKVIEFGILPHGISTRTKNN